MVVAGIVGAGFMGTTHARAYANIHNVKVKYVVDQVPERGQKLASEIGAQALTSITQLLTDSEVDLVDITLPTPLHPVMAISALEAGKHVLVEKPIALTIEEADRMLTTARKCGRLLMVAHVLRFLPEYAAIHAVVESGRLGKPLLGHAYRLSNMPQWAEWFRDPRKTGGAVLDLQIHDIDFLNWIFGYPLSVYAQGHQDLQGGWNSLLTLIEYKSGAASIECSFSKPKEYPFTCGLRLECEQGEIEYHFRAGGASFEQGKPFSYLLIHEDGKPNQSVPIEADDGFHKELMYFVQSVEQGKLSDYLTTEDAYKALCTAVATQKSLESREKIHL
jgi:predicted dehydrogenase